MMLGVTPMASTPEYRYHVPHFTRQEGQHFGGAVYPALTPLSRPQVVVGAATTGVRPDTMSGAASKGVFYSTVAGPSEYGYQRLQSGQSAQPQCAGPRVHKQLSGYDSFSVSSSQCSSRSSSISISPINNKSHITLPPLSELMSPSVYGQEHQYHQAQLHHQPQLQQHQHRQHLEQVTPSGTSYHPSTHCPMQQQVLVNSAHQPSYLQHSNCQHSHSNCHQHPHQILAPGQIRYDSVSSEQSLNSHFPKQEISKSTVDTGIITPNNNANSNYQLTSNVNVDNIDATVRYRKQCPVCGKICSRPSTLKTHLLIHTGDTPFKCTWEGCTKSFNVKSNMLRHLKGHERKQAKKEGRKLSV